MSALKVEIIYHNHPSVSIDRHRSTENEESFLFVMPSTLWLSESNNWSADFEVISNVDWTVFKE